jgi:hypothetical protein
MVWAMDCNSAGDLVLSSVRFIERFQKKKRLVNKLAGKVVVVWFDCLAGTAVAFGKNCDVKLASNLSLLCRVVHTVNDPGI